MASEPETAIVLRVFQQAWALPADGRSAFLMEACRNNAALFDEVQKLFQAMEQTESSFLDTTGTNEDLSATWEAGLTEGTVIGPYRILRPIGKGGMGEVYLASRSSDYRAEVAIKVARRESPHALARFHRERQILATLDHPNVCRILDGGSLPPDARPYLVMEFVKGHLLHEHCDRRNYGVRERVELLLELCRTIADCHCHGVIHRDLSPNNVMATEDGTIKVMDFGLAAIIEETADETHLHDGLTTQLGVGVTLPYASPEQIDFDGTQSLDARSDIYMLGGLMYRLLCGQAPFDGMSRSEQIDAIRFQEPLRPRRIKPVLPLDLETVCLKCLEKNPKNRYATASELGDDLERFLRNEPVKARRASVLERANRWRQRNRILASLLSILAVVTAVGLGSTLAAVRQAWAFQSASQDVLGKLASALSESYFLNPSPYTFERDFRESLSNEMTQYARRTLDSVGEKAGTRPLLAAMHRQLAASAFNEKRAVDGKRHYQESLRLWRLALHDDPSDVEAARSLAVTLAFYVNAQGGGASSVSDLASDNLLPGFSYHNEVDRKVAGAVATFWQQQGLAYKSTGSTAAALDAHQAALNVWQQLRAQEPGNSTYARALATAHHERGDILEQVVNNAAAADLEFAAAREELLNSQTLAPLDLSDLKLLATVTWRTARINMRHLDWENGRRLFDEAISLGKACEEMANGSLDSIAFQSDIYWHSVQNMRSSVPESERIEFVEGCLRHLVRLLNSEKLTSEDTGRLGACQFIVAKAYRPSSDVEDIVDFLKAATNNLTNALKSDEVSRDIWLMWRSKVYLELGDLNLSSLPMTQEEYYRLAQADAEAALSEFSAVNEPLQMIDFVKKALQKIDSAKASDK